MREPLSQHVLGRLVAYFFFGTTALLAALYVQSLTFDRFVPSDIDRPLVLFTATQTFVAGIVWWFLPWERWSRRVQLCVLPVGYAATVTAQFGIPSVALVMAVFHVVLIAFVGLSQEPRWPAAFAFVTGGVYALPLVSMHRWESGVTTVATVVATAASLMGGEVLAWMSSQLRRAHAVEVGHQADIQTLIEVSTSLSHQIQPSEAANLVARLAGVLLHAEATAVLLPDTEEGVLCGAGGWQWPGEVDGLRFDSRRASHLLESAQNGGLAPIARNGSAQVDVLAQVNGNGKGPWPSSTMVLPLKGTGGLVGALALVPTGGVATLDRFVEGIGRTFATQAGLAFERIWMTESLRDASLRDELTSLGNRRSVTAMLSVIRSGDAVAMLDLDHFKAINDTLGHAAGDDVLRSLGSYLSSALRDGDVAARYGGEEFLLVLRQCGDEAGAVVERLLEGWRATKPVTTISAGVAVHREGDAPSETVTRADAALYRAKEGGRDRCGLEVRI